MTRDRRIDILRALAVLLVLGRHLRPGALTTPTDAALQAWTNFGWIGVDLFFVLSGFLVSGLLFQEFQNRGTIHLGRFLIRRGLKIYPAFYVLLVFTLLWKFAGTTRPATSAVVGETLFLQNYLGGLWPHTWSLAVEEHFYLGLGLLLTAGLLLGGTRAMRHLPAVVVGVGLTCLGLRTLVTLTQPFDFTTHLYATHLRIDALACGVLLSYLHHFHRPALQAWATCRRLPLTLLGLAMVSPTLILPVQSPAMVSVGLSLTYLGFAALLLACLHSPGATRLSQTAPGRVLAHIGFHSYSIYLWHLPVIAVLANLGWRNGLSGTTALLWTGAYVLASVLVGIVMARLIEVPVLRLRDRVFPSRTPGNVPQTGPSEPRIQGQGPSRGSEGPSHPANEGKISLGGAVAPSLDGSHEIANQKSQIENSPKDSHMPRYTIFTGIKRRWQQGRSLAGIRSRLLNFWDAVIDRLPERWPVPGRGKVWALRVKSCAQPMHLRQGTSDWMVLREIFHEGTYAPAVEMLGAPAQPPVVVDLGANCGLSVRYWLQHWPGARVLAVEPDDSNLAAAQRNILASGAAGQVSLVRACAAGHARTVQLTHAEKHYMIAMTDAPGSSPNTGPSRGSEESSHPANEGKISLGGAVASSLDGARAIANLKSQIENSPAPGSSPDCVPALTLPQLLAQARITGTIDLLKCDIEGAERELFAACAGWIDQVRAMVVELHDDYTLPQLQADIERHATQAFEVGRVVTLDARHTLVFLRQRSAAGESLPTRLAA